MTHTDVPNDPTSTINTKIMRWLLNGCEMLMSDQKVKEEIFTDGHYLYTNNGEQIRAVEAPAYLQGQGHGFVTWEPMTDQFKFVEDDKGLQFDYEKTTTAIHGFSTQNAPIASVVGKMVSNAAMYWDHAHIRIHPDQPVIAICVTNEDPTLPKGYVLLPKVTTGYEPSDLFQVEQVAVTNRKRQLMTELMNKYSVEELEELLAQV